MAEFQEVMEQWKHRCKHCTDDYSDCNIHSIVCDGFCKMKNFADFMSVEKEVMTWAAEHPEPVYPTWWEWLLKQGVIRAGTESRNGFTYQTVTDKLFAQIDADIAEKLGLQPKEGT